MVPVTYSKNSLNGLGMAQKLGLEMITQPLENASDVAGVLRLIAC